MNRFIFIAIIPFLLLLSCQKNESEEVLITHEVTFQVSTLKSSYEPLVKASTQTRSSMEELKNSISEIRYIVFRNGSKFSEGSQTYETSPTTFGNVTISLPSGTCDVYFTGTGKGTGETYFTSERVSGRTEWGIYGKLREVFYNSAKEITINPETNYSIEMKRQTGAITLNITDAANAPLTFGGLSIELQYYTSWYFSDFSYNPTSISQTFPGSNSNFPQIMIHTWPSLNNTLVLNVLDIDNNIVKSKSITYNVYPNKKTIITGELFGGDQDFLVTINSEWEEDNITEFQ